MPPLGDPGRARFTLRASAAVTNAPYCLALPFRPGEFPSGAEIGAADGDPVQVTVKSRWPDGSARIGIMAGRATLGSAQSRTVTLARTSAAVSGAPLSEAALAASGYEALLSFGSRGSVSLSTLLNKAAVRGTDGRWRGGRVRHWISGPLMSSWTYAAPLGGDAHLMAWFEVRYFGSDQVQVLAWLENGFLLTAGCTGHADRLQLRIQGSLVFDEDVHIANHCRVVAQRGAGVGWMGARTGASVDIDYPSVYLQATGLFPATLASVSAGGSLVGGLQRDYAPEYFGQVPARRAGVNPNGNYASVMGTAGYHGSIGLIPEWDAAFIASSGGAQAVPAVLSNALGSGRFSIHDRDETTLQPLAFASYPKLVLNATNRNVPSSGAASTNDYTPLASLTSNSLGQTLSPETWASSHHPSVGYAAYLISGWTYFLEACQFAATLNYLKQTDTTRQGADGVFQTSAGANTTRGAAWAIRTLVQSAVITPDDDVLAKSFRDSMAANLRFYHQNNVARPAHPQGVCVPYSNYTSGDTPPRYSHAMWMEDFLTAAWGWAIQLRPFPDATLSALLEDFFRWKAKSVIGRLGPIGDVTQYAYTRAAQYIIAVAPASGEGSWYSGAGPWYANWGEAFKATFGSSNSAGQSINLTDAYYPDPTSYWGNMMPAITYAVEAGVDGAAEAYARMTNAPNWKDFVSASNTAPVWAVRPRNPGGRYG